MTFEARYPGRCGACDERFAAGDEVEFVEDSLVHADCEEFVAPVGRNEVVCESCWLIKPCECES